MSREILFRGKRIDNGEWVEGFLMDENCINTPFNDNSCCGRFDDPIEVDPETVCQYTGYTDSAGNKKFEGDIFIYDDEKFVIAFEEARFVAESIEWNFVLELSELWPNEVHVVGNIHDSSELAEWEEETE